MPVSASIVPQRNIFLVTGSNINEKRFLNYLYVPGCYNEELSPILIHIILYVSKGDFSITPLNAGFILILARLLIINIPDALIPYIAKGKFPIANVKEGSA